VKGSDKGGDGKEDGEYFWSRELGVGVNKLLWIGRKKKKKKKI
jgi:hypothetical protein